MKIVYWFLGFFFSILAIISALLPVLQAWFFWILAGVYFSKASPKFRAWFTNCWVYRKFLARFLEKDKRVPLEKSAKPTARHISVPTIK